jgi:hypothetical protein
MTHFLVINGILLDDAVCSCKAYKDIILLKQILTKNLAIFMKFWRFPSFFDKTFTVTSRSKTIIAVFLMAMSGATF